jgi:hypothetical protein
LSLFGCFWNFMTACVNKKLLVAMLVCFGAVSTAANAQLANAPHGVSSELSLSAIVKATDGKEQLVSTRSVKPGEVFQYTNTYKNQSGQLVKQLVATLPIPAEAEFVASTASPAGVMASVDGKVFESVPLVRKVKQADGRLVDQPVPLAEYRFLRWPARDVAAGANFVASARVRVISAASAASASASAPASAPASR